MRCGQHCITEPFRVGRSLPEIPGRFTEILERFTEISGTFGYSAADQTSLCCARTSGPCASTASSWAEVTQRVERGGGKGGEVAGVGALGADGTVVAWVDVPLGEDVVEAVAELRLHRVLDVRDVGLPVRQMAGAGVLPAVGGGVADVLVPGQYVGFGAGVGQARGDRAERGRPSPCSRCNRTESACDSLGRLSAVWLPDRDRAADQAPNQSASRSSTSAVTTVGACQGLACVCA